MPISEVKIDAQDIKFIDGCISKARISKIRASKC